MPDCVVYVEISNLSRADVTAALLTAQARETWIPTPMCASHSSYPYLLVRGPKTVFSGAIKNLIQRKMYLPTYLHFVWNPIRTAYRHNQNILQKNNNIKINAYLL